MVIKWSNFAKTNLQDFVRYSRLSSPNSYIEELVNMVYILEGNPRAGKNIDFSNQQEIRQLVYKMHRIIYRISNNEIQILAVLNSNQDIKTAINLIKKFFK